MSEGSETRALNLRKTARACLLGPECYIADTFLTPEVGQHLYEDKTAGPKMSF